MVSLLEVAQDSKLVFFNRGKKATSENEIHRKIGVWKPGSAENNMHA